MTSARQSYFIYVGNDAMIMPSLTNQGWSSQIDYSPDGSSTLTIKKVAQDSGYEKMRFTHQKKILILVKKTDSGNYSCKDMTKNIIADFQLDIRITGTPKVTFGNFSVIEGQNISIGTCSIANYFPPGNFHKFL